MFLVDGETVSRPEHERAEVTFGGKGVLPHEVKVRPCCLLKSKMNSRIRISTKSCSTYENKFDSEIIIGYYPCQGHAHIVDIKEECREKSLIPGCCSKCCHPSLKNSHEELEGVFFNYHKIYQWKEDSSMDDETHYHSDHIHPQLPRNHLQVSNGDDLSTDETGNTKRGIPDGRNRIWL